MMEIRFIQFFLTLSNKNSITLFIDDVYYAMFYVDDECVNVLLTKSFSIACLYFFVHVDDGHWKRIFTQFFLHVYSLHDLFTTSDLYIHVSV